MNSEQKYEVFQNGKLLSTGSYNNCWIYVHKHQSQSIHYATRYGGWSIKRKEK